jgi:hypothetical protein
MGAPMGSAPAMPVGFAVAGSQPHAAAPSPSPMTPPAARVLPADVSLREVGSVAPATVKHVPPPPPRAMTSSPSLLTPTGRNSTLDTDTPLPDPLPLHESTGRDSLVEMVEILTKAGAETVRRRTAPAPTALPARASST